MSTKRKRDFCKTQDVLRIRSAALTACRCWLNSQGFTEVQGPILLPAVGERPNSFEVNYFGKKAFLADGLQPYSDTFVELFGRVYSVSPSFRAEPLKASCGVLAC
jgi:aspartyl/asparaginyl-tRNA synthetase